ncbi:MAG: hypothetical protein JO331_01175 [Verrucomicrobia bacterium]|nr:hypothetical protein [Verrucomicrobiota bacterium]
MSGTIVSGHLRSKLFRGDQRLEACLVDNASHITPGAVGDHVTKIQTALTLLGEPNIAASEIATKTYGPSTAAAVLAYKTKRNIINRSYQVQADNIVGKMTISALDKELLQCRWNIRPCNRDETPYNPYGHPSC